uniref:SCAN box domain-containing protein n=1 Tax=Cyprinodon variegatus TaxID=28743 RepID=A0A3Q2GB72_CYPVA
MSYHYLPFICWDLEICHLFSSRERPPQELYNRLMDLYRKWIKPSGKSVEEVGEILVLEQYLRTLAPEVRVWVKEHRPATGQQAAELVESGGFCGGVGPRGSLQSRIPDKQLGPVTYELEMPGKRKTRQAYHVNLLKEWHGREPPVSQQLMVQAVQEDEDPPEQFFPAAVSPTEPDLSHLNSAGQGTDVSYP